MGKVEVISSCVIRMAGSNAIPISRLDRTPWDLQLLPLDPIQKGILFHNPLSLSQIDHLKNSLSRTLDFFPPLAGRLATATHDNGKVSFFLECNNAGVEFVHAVAVGTSASDILEEKFIPKIVASFFPLNGLSNRDGVSKPLLAVQVTELVDGVFIACTANHVAVDGVSFWHFFNSWAEISRGSHTISKTPIFKPYIPDGSRGPLRLPPREQDPPRRSPPPPLQERVFHFSKQTLSNLKAKANSEAGTDKISSLQALSAHLWRGVTRCRYPESGEEASFVIIVGARARIPLPEGYFGNALIGAKTTMSAAELAQKGVGEAAVRINELVSQHNKEMIVKVMEDWVENPTFFRRENLHFVVTSSPRHNVYGNDFGWGKPVAVRSGPAAKLDGKLTVFPAAEEGGIDVEVCLAPETMQAIEDDAEFMEPFTVSEHKNI